MHTPYCSGQATELFFNLKYSEEYKYTPWDRSRRALLVYNKMYRLFATVKVLILMSPKSSSLKLIERLPLISVIIESDAECLLVGPCHYFFCGKHPIIVFENIIFTQI